MRQLADTLARGVLVVVGRLVASRATAMLALIVSLAVATPPAWGTIAFVATDKASWDGGNPNIWVMNDDGTGMQPIVEHPALDAHPAFSPDGQKLAFLSNRGGQWAVYLINSDGTGLHKVPNSDFGGPSLAETSLSLLDWLPDGQHLVYRATSDAGGMGIIGIDGTGKTVLTTNGAGDGVYQTVYDMSGGPTADEITVALEASPWQKNLFKYTISTDTWTQMTFDQLPSHAFNPAVNSDGQIVFTRRASWNQLYDLYVMEDQPGAPSVNLTNLSVPEGAYRPDWMAGNQQVVFEYVPGSGFDWQIGAIATDGTNFHLFTRPPGLVCLDPVWAVPEPSTFLLAALGMLGLLGWAWRRRR